MAVSLKSLQPYADENGNAIVFTGDPKRASSVDISFSGKDNILTIDPNALFARLRVDFRGHGNRVTVGRAWGPRPTHWVINVGHGCIVSIGDDVTTTDVVYVVVAEGASVRIGNDCMFATAIELRATDSHAIYALDSGDRVNPSQDVVIGEHCWLATGAVVMSGGHLGAGSVLGHRATLLGTTPENCVVVGAPARVARSGIEWRRPQTLDMPPRGESADSASRPPLAVKQ